MTSLLKTLSCVDGYDPESLGVVQARQLILDLVEPVAGREHLFVRNALGRVLAEDILSTANVPGHDNSAMDGYAVRLADALGGALQVARGARDQVQVASLGGERLGHGKADSLRRAGDQSGASLESQIHAILL